MTHPLSKDIVEKIREEVKKGRSRYKVAVMFGVDPKTIYRYTDDLLKRGNRLSPAKKAWIKRKAKEGKSKYKISLELDVSYQTVRRIAKDFPNSPPGWSGIRGKALGMLQELLEKGYVITTKKERKTRIHLLRKHFPSIQRTRIRNRGIAFLPDKKEEAMRALLEKMNKKVWTYQELRAVTKLFDTDLNRKEKLKFVGKNRPMTKEDLKENTFKLG